MWSTELTDEETDALIDKAAGEVAKRNLQTPAILFLEMHKPLSYIGANASLVFAPFAVPFLGFDFINDYGRLFSKRENVEKLIRKLEQLSKPTAAKDD